MRAASVSERQLPSGRSVVVRIGEEGENLEVRSPRGDVEVRIELTDAGPVVRLRGARLELESPAVAIRCGELRVQADEDIHLNGRVIRLNC